jgi:MOSC domain-containing protein YiiM
MPDIVELLASPVHRFEGRPGDGPAPAPDHELVSEVRVRAGLGIVGDRYFARLAHRDASVTVIARESLPPGVGLAEVRRNILVSGIAVDDLVGEVLCLDSVRLRVHRRAHPCAWMDVTIGPGAWRALRGRGGIRCTPLNDGVLRVGPVTVTQPGSRSTSAVSPSTTRSNPAVGPPPGSTM